jgi:hypothetical protein
LTISLKLKIGLLVQIPLVCREDLFIDNIFLLFI